MALTVTFAGQNWTIRPSISDQRWVLTTMPRHAGRARHARSKRSRLAQVNGNADARFLHSREYAVDRYGIPGPTNAAEYSLVFSLEQWASYAAVSSFLDTGDSAGAAVDVWRPTHFGNASDVHGKPIPNAFSGINVDVGVYGNATIHRLSYHVTLVGKIAFGFLLG